MFPWQTQHVNPQNKAWSVIWFFMFWPLGSKASGYPEANDATSIKRGCWEEVGSQRGNNHWGWAHKHSKEILPCHLREELFFFGQRSRPGKYAKPGQHNDGVKKMLQPPLPHQRYHHPIMLSGNIFWRGGRGEALLTVSISSLCQEQKRKSSRTLERCTVQLLWTFTCRLWYSLLESWSLLISCYLKWRLGVTKFSSSPKWCAAWTS